MTGKKFFTTFLILFIVAVLLVGGSVYVVDPFFHYRAPNKSLYYVLYDQRSQNDGITKRFDYDSIITGTSMSENFRASEFDELFGTNTIKVSYSGATYREINDNLRISYESGHSPEYVLRPLDYTLLVRDKDEMRTDMGEFPEWLTNSNPFDDVKYLLNRDVFINYTLTCLLRFVRGHEGGYTSFDDYSYTGDDNVFSKSAVLGYRTAYEEPKQVLEATEDDIQMLVENVQQNVIELANEHPETTFLYFYPPYSMAYWGGIREEGRLYSELEYIKAATYMITSCDNIHLYTFAGELDITENLDNYRDAGHYSPQINTRILEEIAALEKGENASNDINTAVRLTSENAEDYFEKLTELLENYDYNSLFED